MASIIQLSPTKKGHSLLMRVVMTIEILQEKTEYQNKNNYEYR